MELICVRLGNKKKKCGDYLNRNKRQLCKTVNARKKNIYINIIYIINMYIIICICKNK